MRPSRRIPGRLRLTVHARRRSAQRGISLLAIDQALAWGTEYHVGHGDNLFHLSRGAVSSASLAGFDVRRYLGTTVIQTLSGRIKTVYRTQCPPSRRGRR